MEQFLELNNLELQYIDGGVNGGLIWTGVIGIAGGIVGCYAPGGQVVGGIAIYSGAVSLIAGIVY